MVAEKNTPQSKQAPLLIENLLEQSKKTLLDGKVKGIPQNIVGMPLQAAQQFGWSLRNEEICLPALTLSESAFAHNLHITEHMLWNTAFFFVPTGKQCCHHNYYLQYCKANERWAYLPLPSRRRG